MACGLVTLGSISGCPTNEGGIIQSYGCKLSDITSVTLTSGVISGFTMAATGSWKKYIYDKDGTANFSAPGTRNGNRITYEQTAFIKFGGITDAYIVASDNAAQCCDVVFIHILANGERIVQGFERLATTGAPVSTNNTRTRITPTINTDTSTNEARTEWTISGNANTLPNTTTLSNAAIEAL